MLDNRWERTLFTGLTLLGVFFYAGAFFAWSPLERMLEGEGQYSELCPLPTEVAQAPPKCAASSNALNQMYVTCITVFAFSTTLAGIFADKYGPTITMGLGGFISVSGAALFAVKNSQDGLAFGFAYAVMLPVGGSFTFMGSYAVGFLHSSPEVVFTAISALFDSSTLVYPVFLSLHQGIGMSCRELFLAYAGIGAILFPLIMWAGCLNRPALACAVAPPSPGLAYSMEPDGPPLKNLHVPLQKQPFNHILRSYEFMTMNMFYMVHVLRSNSFIGIQNELLDLLGDTGLFKSFFGYAVPLGALFVPLINCAHAKLGVPGTLQLVNLWGALVSLLTMVRLGFSMTLPLQAINGVLYTGYRAMLFSTNAAYCGLTFGPKNMGSLMGLVSLGGGLVNYLQIPLLQWSRDNFGGGDFSLTVFNACFVVPMVPLILLIQGAIRRAVSAEEQAVVAPPLLGPDSGDGRPSVFLLSRRTSFSRSESFSVDSPSALLCSR